MGFGAAVTSRAVLHVGMAGRDRVFHCAAHTEEWDTDAAFFRVNVLGTDNVLAAARAAKVPHGGATRDGGACEGLLGVGKRFGPSERALR